MFRTQGHPSTTRLAGVVKQRVQGGCRGYQILSHSFSQTESYEKAHDSLVPAKLTNILVLSASVFVSLPLSLSRVVRFVFDPMP